MEALKKERSTGLWWDMESCHFPSQTLDPLHIISMPSYFMSKFGTPNHETCKISLSCTAYHFSYNQTLEMEQILANSGFLVHTIQHGERRELEKRLFADLMLWAMDNPPPADIILLMGNTDMSYVIGKLGKRGYRILVATPSPGKICLDMYEQCHNVFSWTSFLDSIQNGSPIFNSYFQDLKPNAINSTCCNPLETHDVMATGKIKLDFENHPAEETEKETENLTEMSNVPEIVKDTSKNCDMEEQVEVGEKYKEEVEHLNRSLKPNVLDVSEVSTKVHNEENPIEDAKNDTRSVIPRKIKVVSVRKPIILEALKPLTETDFKDFIRKMLYMGDFSLGMSLTKFPEKFEELSKMKMDYKRLGYSKLSALVASCSLLSLIRKDKDTYWVFPSEEGLNELRIYKQLMNSMK